MLIAGIFDVMDSRFRAVIFPSALCFGCDCFESQSLAQVFTRDSHQGSEAVMEVLGEGEVKVTHHEGQ